MKILLVTSFARDMYQASGKHLISSYLKNKIDMDLLICQENFEIKTNYPQIIFYQLETSQYLNNWLEKYKTVIPESFGGLATPESSPKTFAHVCNIKMSRWFRKIASLQYALTTYRDQYDAIMWIDCDCVFLKRLTSKDVTKIIGMSGFTYHLGPFRSSKEKDLGVESGLLTFQRKNGGFQFLEYVCDVFESGKFQEYYRWDDGYVFRMVIDELKKNPTYVLTDLVPKKCRNTSAVIPQGPFGKYIKHSKGHHQRIGVMVV